MFKALFRLLLVVVIIVGIYGVFKPLPEGVNFEGEKYSVSASSLHFLSDRTYVDNNGARHSEQEIFDEIFRMIEGAEHYVLLDMFLYNDFLGTAESAYRPLSGELTDTLIAKKKENPEIVIQVITDPINIIYGDIKSPYFEELRENDIPVLVTDLKPLRDSNPLYSSFWRTLFRWLPESFGPAFLPNLMDENYPKLTVTAYLNLFNFKANHRKVVMADYQEGERVGFSVLVTSANPHDGSSAHSNTALKVDDYLWRDVLETEKAVAEFSGFDFLEPGEELLNSVESFEEEGQAEVQLITERAIKEKILNLLNDLDSGDELDMAMFYFSDRDIIKALKAADVRGVNLRILLDPNKDAFGREKGGIPNRQVAGELMEHTEGNTELRWCHTHGEQCHSKLLIFKSGDEFSTIQGSANLTRRNLKNLNLETNIYLSGDQSVTAINDTLEFFETVWQNEENKIYSIEYQTYAEESLWKTIWYRVGEFSGLSTY